MEIIYKIVVILTGIALLIWNLFNISKKKMDIGIGSWWTIMSVIVIVFGAVFDFNSLLRLVNLRNLALIYMLIVSLVIALYIYGMHITGLKKKTDELAMWVSYAKSLRKEQLSENNKDENRSDDISTTE